MSYKLIKKINEQVLNNVPAIFHPYDFGTMGSFLTALLVPEFGSQAYDLIKKDFKNQNLNHDEGQLSELIVYIESLNNKTLNQVASILSNYINNDFFGCIRSFYQAEVWQIDTQLTPFMEGLEEYRDSILLFVFSASIFPVSDIMKDVMIDFHIFEPDDNYMEIQSILNDFYTETSKCMKNYLAWKYLDSLKHEECHKLISKIESTVPFVCDGCGKNIKSLKSPFISRVEVYPSRSLKFDYDEVDNKDFEKEIKSTLEKASQKSERELTKEVWTEYRLFLCEKCRNTFVNRIENGEFI